MRLMVGYIFGEVIMHDMECNLLMVQDERERLIFLSMYFSLVVKSVTLSMRVYASSVPIGKALLQPG